MTFNGTVNVGDAAAYNVWRNSEGSSIHLAADGNLNGEVEQGDYDVWASHFGYSTGIMASVMYSATSAAVPEPKAVVLLACGLMLAACRRHRRHCKNGISYSVSKIASHDCCDGLSSS